MKVCEAGVITKWLKVLEFLLCVRQRSNHFTQMISINPQNNLEEKVLDQVLTSKRETLEGNGALVEAEAAFTKNMSFLSPPAPTIVLHLTLAYFTLELG